MNSSGEDVTGTDPFEGVNPANGVVFYYNLPKLADSTSVTLTIKDETGKVVRTISGKEGPEYKAYEGAPSPAPVLNTKMGLNRFVWDMRYSSMPGLPEAYLEASFRGRKAGPGIYTAELTVRDKTAKTTAEIEPNPLQNVSPEQYSTYNTFMGETEVRLTEVHNKVNKLKTAQDRIAEVLASVKKSSENKELIQSGKNLLERLNAWDEKMVQRKSKAYDDVENFENKFTAEYLFLINQTESDIPRLNKASIERRAELEAEWVALNKEAEQLINIAIPEFNTKLWNNGIGAVNLN